MTLDRSLPGIQALQHVVVLMLENRSFDHMLGALKATHPNIDGLTGNESNPDSTEADIPVQPKAMFRGQLLPDPHHDFASVDSQIFSGVASGPNRQPNMQGFIRTYHAQQQPNVAASHGVIYHFSTNPPNDLPVLHGLATQFAVFNRWFSSIPGPTLCNRAFAHYGTSFGNVGMNPFYVGVKFKSIYERLTAAGHTAKLYYFDETSSTLEVVNLFQEQAQLFGTWPDFLAACDSNQLPQYSFIEPNYKDHLSPNGQQLFATDQHPDNDVRAGEDFIADVYNRIRNNPRLWPNTALLLVYDEHGGIYDHVPPPALNPANLDGYVAQPSATGTPDAFHFDRLGVRVPAILVSPWVAKGSVINDVFEHACIPATVTDYFIGAYPARSPREIAANTFLGNLSLPAMRADDDCPSFAIQSSS
jgi:phospholipase C